MRMCPPFWGRAGEGQDQSPAAAPSGLTSVPVGSSCLPLTGATAVLPRAQLSHSARSRPFWQTGVAALCWGRCTALGTFGR